MAARKRRIQHVYEITLASGDAEAVLLVAADNESEARHHVRERAASGQISWEGTPTHIFRFAGVNDLGVDEGQRYR